MSVRLWVLHAIKAHRNYLVAKKTGSAAASDYKDYYNIAMHQARILKRGF